MVGGDGGWVGNLGDVVLLTTFEAATGVVPHHNIPFSAVMDQVTAALLVVAYQFVFVISPCPFDPFMSQS